jgi:hypothetical protein
MSIAQQGAHHSDCAYGFTSHKDWQLGDEKIQKQLPIVD